MCPSFGCLETGGFFIANKKIMGHSPAGFDAAGEPGSYFLFRFHASFENFKSFQKEKHYASIYGWLDKGE